MAFGGVAARAPDPPKFEQLMMRRINDLESLLDVRPDMVRKSS
jgi:hypothetical protein